MHPLSVCKAPPCQCGGNVNSVVTYVWDWPYLEAGWLFWHNPDIDRMLVLLSKYPYSSRQSDIASIIVYYG